MEPKNNWIVVSLGGSLIVPDTPDIEFLEGFRELIQELVPEGRKVVIVTGGGQTARNYQKAGRNLGSPQEELDWLGIRATRINAALVRDLFPEAAKAIVTNPKTDALPDANVIIAAGWKPGFSTDYDAAVLAKRLGAKRIVNMSDVSHVYAEDPKKNPAAKRYDTLTWQEFRTLVGEKWKPGLHAPFDPVAARLCDDASIEVAIIGKDLENARHAFRDEEFEGTLIQT